MIVTPYGIKIIGGIQMKKMILKLSGVVASLALVVTFVNANSVCMFLAHQPELPKGAEKLRKF